MPLYSVKQGDCLSSIAAKFRMEWKTIWNHPENARLKDKRKSPNILFPGDGIFVPKSEAPHLACRTGRFNAFVVKQDKPKLAVQLVDEENKPRADLDYVLVIEGARIAGVTDDEGWVRRTIAPELTEAELVVEVDGVEERYQLQIGHLNPTETSTGIQQRLNNLGFDCGEIDGEIGPVTKEAVWEFQRIHDGLDETGILDDATISRIIDDFGS